MSPADMLDAIDTATQVAPRNGGLTLTQWEEDFVESISEQVDSGRSLSPKQTERLTEIWDKT